MSAVARVFREAAHGFEEAAGRLTAVGQGNVQLEVGLGAAQGKPLHRKLRFPGSLQQRIRLARATGLA